MHVLAVEEVAEWFEGFENLGEESIMCMPMKTGSSSHIPRLPVST